MCLRVSVDWYICLRGCVSAQWGRWVTDLKTKLLVWITKKKPRNPVHVWSLYHLCVFKKLKHSSVVPVCSNLLANANVISCALSKLKPGEWGKKTTKHRFSSFLIIGSLEAWVMVSFRAKTVQIFIQTKCCYRWLYWLLPSLRVKVK